MIQIPSINKDFSYWYVCHLYHIYKAHLTLQDTGAGLKKVLCLLYATAYGSRALLQEHVRQTDGRLLQWMYVLQIS